MGISEKSGELLARGEQIAQDLGVFGIGSRVVGDVHAAAEVGAGCEAQHRFDVGLLGGGGIGTVGVGLVTRNVIGWQPVKFSARGSDFEGSVGDVAAEGEGEVGDFVLKGANLFAGGFVFIDTGKPVLQKC